MIETYEIHPKMNLYDLPPFICEYMESLIINRYDGDTRTALSHACEKGHLNVVEWLLNHPGIDIEKGGEHHDEFWTPLHYAARYGYARVIDLLIQFGANKNALTSKKRSTALHLACATGNLDAVKMLLKHNANSDLEDIYLCTPLSLAIHFQEKLVQQALFNANIRISTHDGRRLKRDDHMFRRFHWIKLVEPVKTQGLPSIHIDLWCIICGFLSCYDLLINVRLVCYGLLVTVHHPALRKLVNYVDSLPPESENIHYNQSQKTLVLKNTNKVKPEWLEGLNERCQRVPCSESTRAINGDDGDLNTADDDDDDDEKKSDMPIYVEHESDLIAPYELNVSHYHQSSMFTHHHHHHHHHSHHPHFHGSRQTAIDPGDTTMEIPMSLPLPPLPNPVPGNGTAVAGANGMDQKEPPMPLGDLHRAGSYGSSVSPMVSPSYSQRPRQPSSNVNGHRFSFPLIHDEQELNPLPPPQSSHETIPLAHRSTGHLPFIDDLDSSKRLVPGSQSAKKANKSRPKLIRKSLTPNGKRKQIWQIFREQMGLNRNESQTDYSRPVMDGSTTSNVPTTSSSSTTLQHPVTKNIHNFFQSVHSMLATRPSVLGGNNTNSSSTVTATAANIHERGGGPILAGQTHQSSQGHSRSSIHPRRPRPITHSTTNMNHHSDNSPDQPIPSSNTNTVIHHHHHPSGESTTQIIDPSAAAASSTPIQNTTTATVGSSSIEFEPVPSSSTTANPNRIVDKEYDIHKSHCAAFAYTADFAPVSLRKIRLHGYWVLSQPIIQTIGCLSFIVHLEISHFYAQSLYGLSFDCLDRLYKLRMVRQLKVFPIMRSTKKESRIDSDLLSQFIAAVGSTALTVGLRWEPLEQPSIPENGNNNPANNPTNVPNNNGQQQPANPPIAHHTHHHPHHHHPPPASHANPPGDGTAGVPTLVPTHSVSSAAAASPVGISNEDPLWGNASGEEDDEEDDDDDDNPDEDDFTAFPKTVSKTWQTIFSRLPDNIRSLRLHFGENDRLSARAVRELISFESIKCFTLHGDPGLSTELEAWSSVFKNWSKLRYVVLGHRGSMGQLILPKLILESLPRTLPELALNVSNKSVENVTWYLDHIVQPESFLRINLHITHEERHLSHLMSIHPNVISSLSKFANLETAYLKCGIVTLDQIEFLLSNCPKLSFVGFGIDIDSQNEVRRLIKKFKFDKIVVKTDINWLIAVKSYDKYLLDPSRCIHPVLEAFENDHGDR